MTWPFVRSVCVAACRSILTVAFICPFARAQRMEPPASLVEKLDQLAQSVPPLTLPEASAIAGADRAQIIAFLHEKLHRHRSRNAFEHDDLNAYKILLRLGDERGMQLLAEQLRTEPIFRRSDAIAAELAEAVERSAQPAVIPYLAPLLFLSESPESDVDIPPGGDIPTGDKISFQAGDNILRVLEKAEAIPIEVKQWKRRWNRSDVSREEYREILRDWWLKNKEAFERKDYAAVQPGREWPAAKEEEPTPQTTDRSAPEPPLSAPVASTTTPVASAVESPTPSSGFLWTCAAAAIALLVSLVVFWKRRA